MRAVWPDKGAGSETLRNSLTSRYLARQRLAFPQKLNHEEGSTRFDQSTLG